MQFRKFKETDNARNNTGISKKRQTEDNVDGQHLPMDRIHFGQDPRVLRRPSQMENSCMVWPSLGARTAEGKARHSSLVTVK